jgi:hypothetical protein
MHALCKNLVFMAFMGEYPALYCLLRRKSATITLPRPTRPSNTLSSEVNLYQPVTDHYSADL